MNNTLKLVAPVVLAVSVLASVSPLIAGDFKSEGVGQLANLEKKYVALAEAMPDGKYTWRPGEGVRSVAEVYLHVAAANFGIPRMIGTPPPEGFQFRGYDKSTTDKAEIVAKLKESFAHVKKAVEAAGDANAEVKMFGNMTTTRGAVLFMIEHLGEHLGQSIAYARVNGVVPPWSK